VSDTERKTVAPRENPHLLGHEAAERTLLAAWQSERLHHAWLITGPRGIGKATLAYRFARFVLAGGAMGQGGDLGIPTDHPVFRRVASGGHADLLTVERQPMDNGKRLRTEIVVSDVRKVAPFLALSAAEDGWRVVVIDGGEAMNDSAANALLKPLEEPPQRALVLIVAQGFGRILPTIRSRCRRLSLEPLADDQVVELVIRHRPDLDRDAVRVLGRLANGSVGRALALAEVDGVGLHGRVRALFESLPALDAPAVQALGDQVARAGADALFAAATEMIAWWLGRIVRNAALANGGGQVSADGADAALIHRLSEAGSLDRWLEVWEKATRLMARADRARLDRKQVLLNIFLDLQAATTH